LNVHNDCVYKVPFTMLFNLWNSMNLLPLWKQEFWNNFSDFHGRYYLDDGLLGLHTVWCNAFIQMFRRNVSPPSSGWLNLVHVDGEVICRRKMCQLYR
jgi:hypothetical protein